jgi:ribonuclease HI
VINEYRPVINDDKFIVYTDGACPNNGSKNARSSIGVYFPEKNNIKLKNISKPLQTDNHSNNVAELTAILEALKIIKSSEIDLPIHLYTDSSYCRSILIEWYEKWVRNNLLKNKKNLSLIKTTYDLYKTMNVTIHHVKAHTKNEDEHSYGNRMADHLATSVLK